MRERVGVGWTETVCAHYCNMNLCSTQRPANCTGSMQTCPGYREPEITESKKEDDEHKKKYENRKASTKPQRVGM